MRITPISAIPAVGADPGASSRVVISTATLRLTVSGNSPGVGNYELLRRGEGGIWARTGKTLQVVGVGNDGELVIPSTDDEPGLVQGEFWAVLTDPGREASDLVFLSPVGEIIDSSAFYK